MTIKESTTGRGGNIAYKMVRSKYDIDPKTGWGKVVTLARENLMKASGGKVPGPNVVAAHLTFGAHHGKDSASQKAKWKTRSWNTAESNMHRDGGLSASDKLKLKNYNRTQKTEDKKTLANKFKKRAK